MPRILGVDIPNEKRVEIHLISQPDVPPVSVDQDKIKQVLTNLLSNSIKFTENGEILIRITDEDRTVKIEVSDTGVGIPAEDKGTIFEAWDAQQTPAGGSRQGSGLGLPLAKKLVEAHGRRMWVESTPGRGSKFSFILPKI